MTRQDLITANNLQEQARVLLESLGEGSQVNASAYDTGWLARCAELPRATIEGALAWLRAHQLPDGSWGESGLRYAHDRVIGTLSGVLALIQSGNTKDQERITTGIHALSAWIREISSDIAGPTVGFELIAPQLLHELRLHRPQLPLSAEWTESQIRAREAKLAVLSRRQLRRDMTLCHSLEALNFAATIEPNIETLLQSDGAVGCSPAATVSALPLLNQREAALAFLTRHTQEGGVPTIVPIDMFEIGWVTWNLLRSTNLRKVVSAHGDKLLARIRKEWRAGIGVAGMSTFPLADGDTSGMIHAVSVDLGGPADLAALARYESSDCYITYPLESHRSVSANAHILDALLGAHVPAEDPRVHKIFRFLAGQRISSSYWIDKWNISPFYPTSHIIISCRSHAPDLTEPAVDWMLRSQRRDGSWGFFDAPTLEESAFCIQALADQARHSSRPNLLPALRLAGNWLRENLDQPRVSLWTGKTLYTPALITESAIISSLALTREIGQ